MLCRRGGGWLSQELEVLDKKNEQVLYDNQKPHHTYVIPYEEVEPSESVSGCQRAAGAAIQHAAWGWGWVFVSAIRPECVTDSYWCPQRANPNLISFRRSTKTMLSHNVARESIRAWVNSRQRYLSWPTEFTDPTSWIWSKQLGNQRIFGGGSFYTQGISPEFKREALSEPFEKLTEAFNGGHPCLMMLD